MRMRTSTIPSCTAALLTALLFPAASSIRAQGVTYPGHKLCGKVTHNGARPGMFAWVIAESAQQNADNTQCASAQANADGTPFYKGYATCAMRLGGSIRLVATVDNQDLTEKRYTITNLADGPYIVVTILVETYQGGVFSFQMTGSDGSLDMNLYDQ